MRALAAILPRRDGEVTLTHQWLPDLVRLAITAGDERTARTAAELPAALKDLAAVLARHGRQDEATHALNEAASLYDNLDARWDIQRAQPGSAPTASSGPHAPRAAPGREALTPTEIKIAYLIGDGRSNPTSPPACPCPATPSRHTSPTYWPNSTHEHAPKSSAKYYARTSPHSHHWSKARSSAS